MQGTIGDNALYAELVALFATDPSEALYRAEEELPGDEFVTFIMHGVDITR